MTKKFKRTKVLALMLAFVLPHTSSAAYTDRETIVTEVKASDFDIYDSLNIEKGSYVLQGVCSAEDYILVSAYDGNDLENSVIYVIKDNIVLGSVMLDTSAHVGGICYDDVHRNVWITDRKGTISCYSFNDILSLNDKIVSINKKVDVSEGLTNYRGNLAAAYIQYHDNKIYVGNYNIVGNGILKEYNINKDGGLDTECKNVYLLPNSVQGVTFIDRDNKTYLLVSMSSGLLKYSTIRIYKFDGTKDFKQANNVCCELPAMLENIDMTSDDKLVAVFEANANKYKRFHLTNIDDLYYIDINIILDNNKRALK